MRSVTLSLAMAILCVPAVAQFTTVIPSGTAATEGNTSNAFPWGRGSAASLQMQCIYDSVHFTSQSITYPIVISRLRWRLNGAVSSAGATYTNGMVDMATAMLPAATASTTFAANFGADRINVFQGPVAQLVQPASTPGGWFVDLPLSTPFTYNPSTGSGLVIWCDLPPGVGTGVPALQLDVHGVTTACRVYNSTAYGSPTGTFGGTHGIVVELTYTPASGLYAGFTATPRAGTSPLMVQFTDQSFSSAPGGVTSWAWDLNGDTVIDSTVQNPMFTYNTCGSYNVSLTVTDAQFSPSTLTRNAYIVTDEVTPSFTVALVTGNVFQFTDTSTPVPTSWAWDFNGDTVIDSTVQNPTFAYPPGCASYNASLTVNRLCRGPYTSTRSVVTSPATAQCTALAGGNGNTSTTYVGNMFDLVVNNAQGISVCALTVAPYSFAGPFTCDVYITPGTYVGNNANAAVWRQVGTGTGTTNAGTTAPPTMCFVQLAQSFYLPPGNYGMAVYLSRTPAAAVNIAYSNGPLGPFGNADVTFIPASATAPGIASLGLFSTSTTASRVWNGMLHYGTTALSGDAGYGFFAPGCAGTLGIPGNTASALPKLGQTMTANLSRLNMNAAFMIVGFSRTTSIVGPLPFNLAAFGAPGCFGRVSPDSVLLIVGASNTAAYNLSVPNNAIYLGNMLYTQGLSLDTAINVLGAVATDAAGFIVGQ